MLGRLLLEPDSPATMDELRRASGMSKASLHRELHRALDVGLIRRDATRRPHVFHADRSSAMYEPVAALLRMSVGIEQELRELLVATPGIAAAAIHGSWAGNAARSSSDIDLLVIGDGTDKRPLREELRGFSRRIGRTVDLTLIAPKDLDVALRGENPFLRFVLERPIVDLVGDVAATAAS